MSQSVKWNKVLVMVLLMLNRVELITRGVWIYKGHSLRLLVDELLWVWVIVICHKWVNFNKSLLQIHSGLLLVWVFSFEGWGFSTPLSRLVCIQMVWSVVAVILVRVRLIGQNHLGSHDLALTVCFFHRIHQVFLKIWWLLRFLCLSNLLEHFKSGSIDGLDLMID